MILNRKQLEVYNWFISGMPKDTRTVLLKGSAGTGKSTVISQIARNFKGSVLLTATTNKAKNNLANVTGMKAFTTHSALGFLMTRNGTEEYLSDINEAKEADLLIVDEVSMLPNQVYQKILKSSYKYILFVGDECQLPAVGIKANVVADREIVLTQQMRQSSEDTNLRRYLEKLRESITENKDYSFKENVPTNIVLYDSHKEFCKEYLKSTKSKRILAYSNKVVESYNLNINQGIRFSIGDLLVLDKPLGKAKNGDIVEVTGVGEMSDRYCLSVQLEEHTYPIFVMKSKKLEELVLNKALEQSQEMYWHTADQLFHPKHIYASTIHKAQGQTLDEVFIDATDIASQLKRIPTKWNRYNKPISKQEFLKLMYVAISRMKEKAHLFIGNKREYKYLKGQK